MGHDNSTTAPESVLFTALAAAAITPDYRVFLDKFELGYQKQNYPSICLIPRDIDYDAQVIIKNGQSCASERLSIEVVLWAPDYDGLRALRSFLRTTTNSIFVGFAEYERFIYDPAGMDDYGRSGTWPIKIRTDLPLYNNPTGSATVNSETQTVADITPGG